MKINIKAWRLLLIIYFLLLMLFVVIKFRGDISIISARMRGISESRELGIWNYNLIPLHTTAEYFLNIMHGYARLNILGNIVPFMPLGFLIPLSLKNSTAFIKAMGICLCIILGIELFQFATMLGYFDVDDIWLNLTGCIIGYVFYFAFFHRQKRMFSRIGK